jgi:hypothetical protein
VRDRVRRVAPVFAQGRDLAPVAWGGRLSWAVHLYAVTDRFPLSQRMALGGGAVSYAQLAATALVDAATGDVRLVAAARPDPIARTWLALLAPLVTSPDGGEGWARPVAALPPATDGAVLQLRTLVEHGGYNTPPGSLRLPDSAFAGGGPPPLAVRMDSVALVGWSVPVLDQGERLVAVATAVGGASRTTWRSRAQAGGPRWPTMARQVEEAVAAGAGARPTVVPADGGPLVVAVTGAGDRVAVTDGAAVGVGPTVADAMRGLRPADPRWRQAAPPSAAFVPSLDGAARQVDRMRDAMRRGDWRAFGAAFDSLARAVGRPPM